MYFDVWKVRENPILVMKIIKNKKVRNDKGRDEMREG